MWVTKGSPSTRVWGNVLVEGDEDFLPINERFFVGGSNLRGFDKSGIGPRDVNTNDALGGRQFFTGTVELYFPLGLPEELQFRTQWGGVSACATCDGFFYKGKHVLVVGGGDTAMEEATFLTKFADKVTIVHRRDSLRASKIMQDRARGNPKIAWLLDSVVEKILGGEGKGVSGAAVRNVKTGQASEVAAGGIFMAIGHVPNTALFKGHLEMDENGYLLTHDGTTATSELVGAM